MKLTFHAFFPRVSAALRPAVLCATLALPGAALAVAPTGPAQSQQNAPDLDKRMPAAPPANVLAQREQGRGRLLSLLPNAAIDLNPLVGSPQFIRSVEGFLSGPNGQGRGITAAGAQGLNPNENDFALKAFLNEHAALFGHGAAILNGARVKRNYVDSHNGLRTLVYEQRLDSIPVFHGVLMGHITSQGELTSISSLFVPEPAQAADAGTPGRASFQTAPPISADKALMLAGQSFGADPAAIQTTFVGGPRGDGDYQVFKTPQEAFVRQVWLPLNRFSLRLAWEVISSHPRTLHRYQSVVDAQTGEVWYRKNLTCNISDATYNVFTSDSPSPFTPSLPAPGNYQPPLVSRTVLTYGALDTNASPAGWVPDGPDPVTTGNNIDAFLDRDFDQQPDVPRPIGTNRIFDFPLDLTQDPTNYTEGSTVQLFWRGNWYHDRLWQLGFTESSGNYQEDNFGRGGFQGDPIICYVQSGASNGIANNSMFMPAPDGFSGQCFMFVFDFPSPIRDGSLDQEVVIHELTHGTSWRLVGGGMTLGSLQGDGMGEGWSDFYAFGLLGQPTDNPNATYATGGYASYRFYGLNENYYYGIRHFPYSTDMSKNPFTFKDIDPAQISSHPGVPRSPLYPFYPAEANEVHHQGEVWCATLWEVHANLVAKYGWNVGNELCLRLVTDGMKLTPPLPNFLQARDAILLADKVLTGGANAVEIWRGFAKRGMGFSATSPSGTTTAGVFESFDMPGLQLDRTVISGGNGNGVFDPNECDNLQVYLRNNSDSAFTGISGRLFCTTPGVIVAQSLSPYADTLPGYTNVNLAAYKVSIAPYLICGTALNFYQVVKTDQGTFTNYFTLGSGVPQQPIRFDSRGIVAIPDQGSTNSVIVVSNILSAVTKVTVSMYIRHTFDSDLVIQLISPEGITNTLSANNGGSGQNYGIGCSPEQGRTTFDDSATVPVFLGQAPFIGSFQPEQSLSVYVGKSGTNVNGAWRLRVADQYQFDTGVIECWSLFLSPVACAEGGGECPGSDLAVGATPSPEPVIKGDTLAYVLSVTNNGPSSAKNVVATQVLPPSMIYSSAIASQGAVSQVGGVVTANFGPMNARGVATATIFVVPTIEGTFTSSVNASSEQFDPDPSNNNVVVVNTVRPPTSDLAVGLAASPSAVTVGSPIAFTVTVTNNGPSVAHGTTVTNVFPSGISVLSATVSQGFVTTIGNTVIFTAGTLTNGASANVIINGLVTAEGTFTTTATAVAAEFDPIVANSTATLTTIVGPAADLAVTVSDFPDPVVLRSNLTYTIVVTNKGPSDASSAILTFNLPPLVNLISNSTTAGVISISGSTLTVNFGVLSSGAAARIQVVVSPTIQGPMSATATATASQPDPVLSNNSATATTQVSPPFVSIVAAGASLTLESFSPPNGAVDNGETVTATLRLRNAGNASNTNLIATLLTSNGITPVGSASQTYGVLPPSGFPVGRSFRFTANGSPGETVTAVLKIQDGPNSLTNVSYNFVLPNVYSFTNTNTIVIRDATNALPYPSTIVVADVPGTVGKVTASLAGFAHTYPKDVDVRLTSPSGSSTLLLTQAGTEPVSGIDMTFDDAAPAPAAEIGQILSGTYQPSAPALSALNGGSANGTWALFVSDTAAGDAGVISDGWSLAITTLYPVNQVADIGLSVVSPPSPSVVAGSMTYVFTVTNSGPGNASFVGFTNPLPAGLTFVSATSSQGNVALSGSSVVGVLGALNAGSNATVTVVVLPDYGAIGVLTNSASASSIETDLNTINNSASAVTIINLPLADVSVAQSIAPSPAVAGFGYTNTLVVTNSGPGQALSLKLNFPLPAGVTLVSAKSSSGTVTNSNGQVIASLGDINPNSGAVITLVLSPSLTGSVTNVATLTTLSSDNNLVGNSSVLVASVTAPSAHLAAAGARLVSESGPVNGTVDPGETVTVSLALTNSGFANTANLIATLLNTGGVTPVGANEQTYGAVLAGGSAVSRQFSFVGAGLNGGVVTAALALRDGAQDLGNVEFVFYLPAKASFLSSAAISVPDRGGATPYPARVYVSGMTGLVSKVVVTLNGVAHGFPHDLSVLLVNPSGASTLLMSHAGGGRSLTNETITFDDAAAVSLPASDAITNGTYLPTAYPAFISLPAPAPKAPYGASLSALNNVNANGAWSLYVFDDTVGDSGMILNGWSLDVTTLQTVNPVADLSVASVSAPSSVTLGGLFTNTVSVANAGPEGATGAVVTHTLASGASVHSVSVSSGSSAVVGNTITWTLGNVSFGANPAMKVVAKAEQGGLLVSGSTVAGIESDLNSANNSGSSSVNVIVPVPATLTGSYNNGVFQLNLSGQSNLVYVIETSTNLLNWTPFSTNTSSPAGSLKVIDSSAGDFFNKYYRSKQAP